MNQDQPWMLVENMQEIRVLESSSSSNVQRKRSNEISHLMGNYMLQGYRMLDRLCNVCDTILLLDRSNKDYCVSCKDLNPMPVKDNGDGTKVVTNGKCNSGDSTNTVKPTMPPKIVMPMPRLLSNSNDVSKKIASPTPIYASNLSKKVEVIGDTVSKTIKPSAQPLVSSKLGLELKESESNGSSFSFEDPELNDCTTIIKNKIVNLSKKLQMSQSTNEVLELSSCIKSCSDCLISLKNLAQ